MKVAIRFIVITACLCLAASMMAGAGCWLGQKITISQASREASGVLRDLRAYPAGNDRYYLIKTDERFFSVIWLRPETTELKYASDVPSARKAVAALKVIQGRNLYVVLYDDGAIEEYTGPLNQLP